MDYANTIYIIEGVIMIKVLLLMVMFMLIGFLLGSYVGYRLTVRD
jgi:hypothetical protein